MEGLAITVFLLVILRFVFRVRGNYSVSNSLSWIILPLLISIVILHFGPRFFPGAFGEKQEKK